MYEIQKLKDGKYGRIQIYVDNYNNYITLFKILTEKDSKIGSERFSCRFLYRSNATGWWSLSKSESNVSTIKYSEIDFSDKSSNKIEDIKKNDELLLL